MNFGTILAPLDLSARSGIGFSAALGVAQLFGARTIHLLNVVTELVASTSSRLPEEKLAAARQRLDCFATPPATAIRVVRSVVGGVPAAQIVATAQQGADLVVITTEGTRGLERLLLGSVSHAVARISPCPVLIVRKGAPYRRPERVMAAIDLSPISEQVIAHAGHFARQAGAGLLAFHACDLNSIAVPGPHLGVPTHLESAHRKALEQHVASLRAEGLGVQVDVSTDQPTASAILLQAIRGRADLLVIGASGHNAWERFFLGSTATRILIDAPCAVLVVPDAHKAR